MFDIKLIREDASAVKEGLKSKNVKVDFEALRNNLKATEAQLGMKVYVMHEDIFRYMHRI